MTHAEQPEHAHPPSGTNAPPATGALEQVDAYWRAANYLSVGQIYLLDNPLLREPLKPEHLAAVIETLDLNDVTVVGHSTGGAEVARYIGRHGTSRVAKAVLISAAVPALLQSDANPEGLPIEAFDGIRAGLMADRSQFYRDLAVQFYGTNREGANVSQGILDQFWMSSMQSGLKNSTESVTSLQTDFTQDLAKFDVPTLLVHGGDDQVVPVGISTMKSAGIIKDAKDIIYPGAPQGITATHQDEINSELLRVP